MIDRKSTGTRVSAEYDWHTWLCLRFARVSSSV